MDGTASVLVVDDDPGVRAMLLEYLGGHRYAVRAAATAPRCALRSSAICPT